MPAPSADSLVDVVDSDDRVIGQVPRARLAADDLSFRVVHLFLFNSKGEFLLAQLGAVRTNDPGKWGSSVAAHLWAGESYAHAARRRLLEELGVEAHPERVAVVPIQNGRATKFVGLYTAVADKVSNREPDHIGHTKYVTHGVIRDMVARDDPQLTDTFKALYTFFESADKPRGQ